jgi:hypothetical protein
MEYRAFTILLKHHPTFFEDSLEFTDPGQRLWNKMLKENVNFALLCPIGFLDKDSLHETVEVVIKQRIAWVKKHLGDEGLARLRFYSNLKDCEIEGLPNKKSYARHCKNTILVDVKPGNRSGWEGENGIFVLAPSHQREPWPFSVSKIMTGITKALKKRDKSIKRLRSEPEDAQDSSNPKRKMVDDLTLPATEIPVAELHSTESHNIQSKSVETKGDT